MLQDKHQFIARDDKPESVFCRECRRPKSHPIHRLPDEDARMIKGVAEPTKQG